MNVIFQGGNGNLLQRWWEDGSPWKWGDPADGVPPGTEVGSAPAVVGWTLGAVQRINVFIRGANGHLLGSFWDGVRWNWTDHGLPPGTEVGSATAITTWAQVELRFGIFTQGANGNRVERYWV
jgi:hypothetical protein